MLKNKQVGGYKFRRQHSIGEKVVDFYCASFQLTIELDGEPHADLINIDREAARDEQFISRVSLFFVMRIVGFTNTRR